jgi:hypothetical protein
LGKEKLTEDELIEIENKIIDEDQESYRRGSLALYKVNLLPNEKAKKVL